MDEFKNNDKFLYLGIDAGMFKTSVCTSDGKKISERTVISSPLDNSGRSEDQTVTGNKVPNSDNDQIIAYPGNELRSEADVIAFRKFLKSLLEKHNALSGDTSSYAILGIASNMDKTCKKKLLEISREIFTGAMLVDDLFCIAYNKDLLDNAMIVDIGLKNTDICIIDGDVIQENDCLTLPCAGYDIDREIVKLIKERWPDSKVTEELARQWKETYGHLGSGSDQCIVTVPLESGDVEQSIADELQIACEFVVIDIVSGLTRVLSEVSPDMRESLRNNIHILGGTSNLSEIGTFIENELKELGGGKVFLDLDSVFGISEGALKLAQNMPLEFWQQLAQGRQSEELIS